MQSLGLESAASEPEPQVQGCQNVLLDKRETVFGPNEEALKEPRQNFNFQAGLVTPCGASETFLQQCTLCQSEQSEERWREDSLMGGHHSPGTKEFSSFGASKYI